MSVNIIERERLITSLEHVYRSSLTPRKINHTQGRAWDGFCYILSGRCHYRLADGSEFTATEGCVLYLAKGALYHMTVEEGPYTSIVADFSFDGEPLRQSEVFHVPQREELEQGFFRLYQRFSVKPSGYRSECLSLLYHVYAILQATRSHQYLSTSSRQRMERARTYVLEHFSDSDLSVKELARGAEMSEVYFRKQFQSVCGCSPVSYIVNTRLSNAKELMRCSELSLEEIARQCGFSTLSYFCRVFREKHGISPGRYRSEAERESF